ncbi:MAG: hypothetical protein E6G07_05275 [Actinobacteria bacterium]|nr:MAG: hypothetical protein E6G07_05275 [Actinomycetota bacterium]
MQEDVGARGEVEEVRREQVVSKLPDPGHVLELVGWEEAVGAGEDEAVLECVAQELRERHHREQRQPHESRGGEPPLERISGV